MCFAWYLLLLLYDVLSSPVHTVRVVVSSLDAVLVADTSGDVLLLAVVHVAPQYKLFESLSLGAVSALIPSATCCR